MKITAQKADITLLEVEAIVNPANSHVTMGGGLAGILRLKGGEEIRRQAQKQTPVPVGEAVVTGAGRLPCIQVIHAPTMEKPAMRIPIENVRLAMKAALKCAEENGVREVAVPGLGTGVGGVKPKDAAAVMVEEAGKHKPKTLQKIILVGYGQEMYQAFEKALKRRINIMDRA